VKNIKLKLIVVGVVSLFVLILIFSLFDIVRIKGYEVGVKEDFWTGVQEEPLRPKTYFVWPWQNIQVYNAGVRVFVMNDKVESDAVAGRAVDSYLVQSADNQDMHLSLQTQWRVDPAHVVSLHKEIGPEAIEERALRPDLLRVVKNHATMREAIEAYSGQGLVDLQKDIEEDLMAKDGELRMRGIIVDSFVIEHIKLDPEYVIEIKGRQVAMQKELRAVQEEKAALALAKKAKAEAQADYEKTVVEAERDKQVAVLAAEAENEKEILKAEAAKQKTVLEAEAEKEAGELRAAGIVAIGEAEAQAQQQQFAAYNEPGAELYAKIQIAEAMGKSFSNIKGYLPENMQVFTLSESFTKAIESVVGPGKLAPTPRP
jgi:regulator of protease activity HflC (stomatin/prohibitin superfamily)